MEPLQVSRPCFFGEELAYVEQALRSTQISGSGSFVAQMEALVAAAATVPHAVVVSSGTSALDLAFECLEVKAGDEVIVPNFTMFAPIAALLRRGAVIVPVDADATWNIDVHGVEAALTDRTKGIVMVHTYGHPADAISICNLARCRGIWVLEDAAEAMGATLDDRAVGSFADIATFSFYSNKVVTCGEGGAVVTQDAQMAERLRALRNLSFGDSWSTRFIHNSAGFNFRLSNVLAAIGCAQLKHLNEALAAKRAVATHYRKALANMPGITLPPQSSRVDHSYWVFGILVPSQCDRSEIASLLAEEGIETRPFFYPVHRQPCVPPSQCSFPVSDQLSSRGLYLPSYVGISELDVDRVVSALLRAVGPLE